jgi:hypothetical protein
MPKEPQSYGSQADWVEGDTGETVTPTGNQGPIEDIGGFVSDVQLAENIEPTGKATTEEEQPVTRVTDQAKGAKRGGFFKNRDY